MSKDIIACDSYTCLLRTCRYHRCHISKRTRKRVNWKYSEDECSDYKGMKRWETVYRSYIEDDEDEYESEED